MNDKGAWVAHPSNFYHQNLLGIAEKYKDTAVECTRGKGHLPTFCQTGRECLVGVLAWPCPGELEEGATERGSIRHWWAACLLKNIPDLKSCKMANEKGVLKAKNLKVSSLARFSPLSFTVWQCLKTMLLPLPVFELFPTPTSPTHPSSLLAPPTSR